MSFHDTELNVIRWAEANGKLTECSADYKALKTVQTVGDLCFAIAAGEQVEISDAMGRVAIDMIVLCAMLDIDLAKSLETAFNKISAKPVEVTKAEAARASNQMQAAAAATSKTVVFEGFVARGDARTNLGENNVGDEPSIESHGYSLPAGAIIIPSRHPGMVVSDNKISGETNPGNVVLLKRDQP